MSFSRNNLHFLEKGDVFFVLSADKKSVIQLRDVAFDIWKYLDKPKKLYEIVEHISEIYNENKRTINKDVKNWLKDAISEGIITEKS